MSRRLVPESSAVRKYEVGVFGFTGVYYVVFTVLLCSFFRFVRTREDEYRYHSSGAILFHSYDVYV